MNQIEQKIADAIYEGRQIHIVSDFDGTLSPHVKNPEDAAIDPVADEALSNLSVFSNVTITILTGRDVSFMEKITGDRFDIIGSHGVEFVAKDGSRELHDFSADETRLIESVKEEIRALAERSDGGLVAELDKTGAVSVKSFDAGLLEAAKEIMQRALSSANTNDTFALAEEGENEVEIRPNEKKFGKAYGLSLFINPPDDALVVFLCDSLRDGGTDVSAARIVRARGENGLVIRVDNRLFSENEIPKDALPHATYSSPSELGMALSRIVAKVHAIRLDNVLSLE